MSVTTDPGFLPQGARLGQAGETEGTIAMYTLDSAYTFRHTIGSATFNGTRDDVSYWGYNITAGGIANEVPGENSLWFGMEANYNNGTNHMMEFNLDYQSADGGTNKRFMGFEVNRSTHVADWAFAGSHFRIEDTINNDNFRFIPHSAGMRCWFRHGGGSGELLQIGYDDGVLAPDFMLLGPGTYDNDNGVGIKKGGGTGIGVRPDGSATLQVGIADAAFPAIVKLLSDSGATAFQFQQTGALYIGNTSAAPSGTGFVGIWLYAESGVLKFRSNGGIVWNFTQQSANADTSGATLGQLETEVNEIKAVLRTIGIIAT